MTTNIPTETERDWTHEPAPFKYRQRPSAAELEDADREGTIFLGRAGCAAFGQDKARVSVPRDLAPEGSPHHAPERALAWAERVHYTRDMDALRGLRRAAGANEGAGDLDMVSAGRRADQWTHDDAGIDRADCQDALAGILRIGGPDVRALILALAPEATGAEPKADGSIDAAMTNRNGARGRSLDDARVLAYGWQGRVAARLGITRHTLARRIDALRRDFGAFIHASTILGRGIETRGV